MVLLTILLLLTTMMLLPLTTMTKYGPSLSIAIAVKFVRRPIEAHVFGDVALGLLEFSTAWTKREDVLHGLLLDLPEGRAPIGSFVHRVHQRHRLDDEVKLEVCLRSCPSRTVPLVVGLLRTLWWWQ